MTGAPQASFHPLPTDRAERLPGPSAPDGSPDPAWERYRDGVQATLAAEQRAARNAEGLRSASFSRLWDRLAASLEGGKRTRPRLLFLAFRAFNGRDLDAAATLGAGLEMLHAALLIHDDVIDRDLVRRGSPTLGARYQQDAMLLGHSGAAAEHAGHAAAIIGGDVLLAGSLRLAALAGVSAGTGHGVLEVVHHAVLAAASGELDDLLFSLGADDIPVAEVLRMERLKTAAYSFEAPLRAGALLAGADPAAAARLGRIGRNIGIAYQIVDDVLGTFGRPDVTGKSIDSDLRSDKRTVLNAYAHHDPAYRSVRAAYRRGEATIEDLRSALHASGAEVHARELAARLVSRALADAQTVAPETSLAADLARLCAHVLERES